jgi:hypothetical protein
MQYAKKFLMMRLMALSVAVLAAFSGSVRSESIHAPMLCEHGPLRYLFDFDEPATDRNLKLWSAAYSRYASAAYIDTMGTQTDELSRLFFNHAK